MFNMDNICEFLSCSSISSALAFLSPFETFDQLI